MNSQQITASVNHFSNVLYRTIAQSGYEAFRVLDLDDVDQIAHNTTAAQ